LNRTGPRKTAEIPPEVKNFVRERLPRPREQGREPTWEALPESGSGRSFYRVASGDRTLIVVYNPHPAKGEHGLTENDSYLYVARHLKSRGISVPGIIAAEPEKGLFLVEDLGRSTLREVVGRHGAASHRALELYHEVIRDLVIIQTAGYRGFNPRLTHNRPYTADFALEWEAEYFRRAFLEGWLDLRYDRNKLEREFRELASRLSALKGEGLLYRDFQSSNIIIGNDRPGYVDFQGARPGPLAYDPASLLNDPYVNLPQELSEELLEFYLDSLAEILPVDRSRFRADYPVVAAHRGMQVLGAYGYLSRVRGKVFFERYIPPALVTLYRILQEGPLQSSSYLRSLVKEAMDKLGL